MQYPQLSRSIILNLVAQFLLHTGLLIIALPITPNAWLIYLTSCLSIYGLLYGSLFYFRKDFVNVKTGRSITKVELANKLTVFRVGSTPTILTLAYLLKTNPAAAPWLLAYIALAFISDFLDGKIARWRNQDSRVGSYLDSGSDYLLLFIVSMVFAMHQLIDTWFLIIFMSRFGIQWILVAILILTGRGKNASEVTWLGKASVFAVMVFFGLSTLQLMSPIAKQGQPTLIAGWLFWLEPAVIGFLLASLVEKIIVFGQALRRPKQAGP